MSALAADAALHDLTELLRSLFGDAPVNSPQALEFERARWDLALAMKRIAAGAPTLPNDRSGAGNPSIPDASRSNTLMIKVAIVIGPPRRPAMRPVGLGERQSGS